MPISRVAQAKTGFHSVTSPFLRHFSATVFGRSNTHTSGAPPQLSRCCARLRTRVSTVSSFTTETRIQREYFRREAKKRMRRAVPSINSRQRSGDRGEPGAEPGHRGGALLALPGAGEGGGGELGGFREGILLQGTPLPGPGGSGAATRGVASGGE